ncbi:hypothetical protein ACFWFI_38350, partial [Streptomyces sp. NPDC060209]
MPQFAAQAGRTPGNRSCRPPPLRGLGTAWTTPHPHYEREAAELLGIPYERVIRTALIPVAHTIGTDFRAGPRVDPDDIAHRDTWWTTGGPVRTNA